MSKFSENQSIRLAQKEQYDLNQIDLDKKNTDLRWLKKVTEQEPKASDEDNRFEDTKGWTMLWFILSAILLVIHIILKLINWIFSKDWGVWDVLLFVFFGGIVLLFISAVLENKRFDKSIEQYKINKRKYDENVKKREQIKKDIPQLEKNIKDLKEQIIPTFERDIRDIFTIPISDGTITDLNYDDAVEKITEIDNAYVTYTNLVDSDELKKEALKQYVNLKLAFFYRYSIYGEASEQIYKNFEQILNSATNTASNCSDETSVPLTLEQRENNYKLLRKEEKFITKYEYDESLFVEQLNENKMIPIIQEFEKTKDIDTSFLFFTDTTALAEKTKFMAEIYKAASEEYAELKTITDKISIALEAVRIYAYRNIYLGVELINYVRENGGGKGLVAQKDSMQTQNIGIVNIEGQNLQVDSLGQMLDVVYSNFEIIGDALSDRKMRKFVRENPKLAAGMLALNVVASAVEVIANRISVISNNNKQQEKMVENLSVMYEGYISGQAGAFRMMELYKAIVKANEAFMSIYIPLRDKVFGSNESLTMKEMQQLVLATQEYKKIGTAQI